jgi:uncharacterized protein (TIGR03067 family)
MTLVRVLVLGVAAGLVSLAAAQEKKAAKLDVAKLAGTYEFVSGVKDGAKVPADNLKAVSFIVTKDTLELKSPDGSFKFKYTVDATKAPAAIDMEITDGPIPDAKGMKRKGIVTLSGDTLMLAYGATADDTPKDFEGKTGHSFTLKKVKM